MLIFYLLTSFPLINLFLQSISLKYLIHSLFTITWLLTFFLLSYFNYFIIIIFLAKPDLFFLLLFVLVYIMNQLHIKFFFI